MHRLLIVISILLISGCSTIGAPQKQTVEILETNPTQVSSAYNQYITIATYFEQQAEVPYIARVRVKEGLPSDFKNNHLHPYRI